MTCCVKVHAKPVKSSRRNGDARNKNMNNQVRLLSQKNIRFIYRYANISKTNGGRYNGEYKNDG